MHLHGMTLITQSLVFSYALALCSTGTLTTSHALCVTLPRAVIGNTVTCPTVTAGTSKCSIHPVYPRPLRASNSKTWDRRVERIVSPFNFYITPTCLGRPSVVIPSDGPTIVVFPWTESQTPPSLRMSRTILPGIVTTSASRLKIT